MGLFGMGYFLNVHDFWFYLVMQMVAGLFQATEWPSVVAVIGNWFWKRKRGLIMGIWNFIKAFFTSHNRYFLWVRV